MYSYPIPAPPIQMACLFLYINDVFPLFSLFILLKCQVFKKTNGKVVLQPITLKHHKKEEKPFIHFSLQRSFILFMMIICRLNTAPPFTLFHTLLQKCLNRHLREIYLRMIPEDHHIIQFSSPPPADAECQRLVVAPTLH